jgi:hypothetical protein
LRRGKIYRNLQGWRARGIATLLVNKMATPGMEGQALSLIEEILATRKDVIKGGLPSLFRTHASAMQALLSAAVIKGRHEIVGMFLDVIDQSKTMEILGRILSECPKQLQDNFNNTLSIIQLDYHAVESLLTVALRQHKYKIATKILERYTVLFSREAEGKISKILREFISEYPEEFKNLFRKTIDVPSINHYSLYLLMAFREIDVNVEQTLTPLFDSVNFIIANLFSLTVRDGDYSVAINLVNYANNFPLQKEEVNKAFGVTLKRHPEAIKELIVHTSKENSITKSLVDQAFEYFIKQNMAEHAAAISERVSQEKKQDLLEKALVNRKVSKNERANKVRFLLDRRYQTKPSSTSLIRAALYEELFDIVFAASDQNTRRKALMEAISSNDVTPSSQIKVERLLEVVNPNFIDEDGNSPLILATIHRPRIVKAILAKMNFSPTTLNLLLGHVDEAEIIGTIMSSHLFLSLDSRNSNNMTPLTGAVRAGQVASVDALLTDPEIKNHLNKTTTLAEVLAVASPPNTVKFRPCRAAIACLKYIDADAVIEYVTTIFIPGIREVISNSEIQNCLKERLKIQLTDAEKRFRLDEAPAAELGR